MASIKAPASAPSPGSCCYRLTARGRMRVDMADKAIDTTSPLLAMGLFETVGPDEVPRPAIPAQCRRNSNVGELLRA